MNETIAVPVAQELHTVCRTTSTGQTEHSTHNSLLLTPMAQYMNAHACVCLFPSAWSFWTAMSNTSQQQLKLPGSCCAWICYRCLCLCFTTHTADMIGMRRNQPGNQLAPVCQWSIEMIKQSYKYNNYTQDTTTYVWQHFTILQMLLFW